MPIRERRMVPPETLGRISTSCNKVRELVPRSSYANTVTQGKNIFEAASQIPTLERLIFSGLVDVTAVSGGKYTHVYHFDSKGHAIKYARETYPELMRKTSILQVTGYLSNWLTMNEMMPRKGPDGRYVFMLPFGEVTIPVIAAEEDTGPFVEALLKVPPGKNLMAYREVTSTGKFATSWSQALGKEVNLLDPSSMGPPPEMDDEGKAFMQEFVEGAQFMAEFGYAGQNVDKTVVTPDEVRVSVSSVSLGPLLTSVSARG
jgi:hypothetical protein